MAMLQLGFICALPPVKSTNMVADTLKTSAEMGTILRDEDRKNGDFGSTIPRLQEAKNGNVDTTPKPKVYKCIGA